MLQNTKTNIFIVSTVLYTATVMAAMHFGKGKHQMFYVAGGVLLGSIILPHAQTLVLKPTAIVTAAAPATV